MNGNGPLIERSTNTPTPASSFPSSSSPPSSSSLLSSKTGAQKKPGVIFSTTGSVPRSSTTTNGVTAGGQGAGSMSSADENGGPGGFYRSPSDAASPVTQKITALKTRRMNKSNLKQRSLFANTVSNQHLKQSTSANAASSSSGSSGAGGGRHDSIGVHGTGSQSEGSMADDELDGGALSDKSDDTVIVRRGDDDDDDDDGVSRGGRGRVKNLPDTEDRDRGLDDGYLADESERN